jgi:thiaminase/transcriptional activator TenA
MSEISSFSGRLWNNISGIYTAILAHPFIKGLTEGTLSHERFSFYLQQDALYLTDFARALNIAASRSPDAAADFTGFAADVYTVEKALHTGFFRAWGIEAPETRQSPACFAYTNYLIAAAYNKTYEETVAALLPCFWIYREVGNHILQYASPRNPYQKWIDTYAGEEFSVTVDKMINITNNTAEKAGGETRRLMEAAFETASRLEWLFWDSAYRLEAWLP